MDAYNELSREELVTRLCAAEKQLEKAGLSRKFNEGIRPGERQSDLPSARVAPDGKIVYVNKALCRMNGFQPEEVLGYAIADFMEKKNRQWNQEMFAKMIAGECNMFRGEHYFRIKNNGWICLDVLALANRNEAGCFLHATYIFNDITENKRNENELIDLLDTQNRIAHSLMLMMERETGAYENDILQIILERYGADRAYIIRFDWKENTSSNIFEITAQGIEPEIDHLQHVPNDRIEVALSRFRSREPFIVNELNELDREKTHPRNILEEQHIQSAILFPIFINEQLWGCLGLDMVRRRKYWSREEIEWLESFTGILSVGLGQKLAQDLLVSQKQTFDMILDSGSLGYWKLDTGLQKLECSDSYFSMLGYTGEKFSFTLDDFWQWVHPDDIRSFRQFLKSIIEGSDGEKSREFRLRNSSGEWVWVLSKIIQETQNVYTGSRMITGIHVNIDESKKAALKMHEKDMLIRRNEQKLRVIFENLPVGIMVFDEKGNYFDSNNELLSIFGLKNKKEIENDNLIGKLKEAKDWHKKEIWSFEFEYDPENQCVIKKGEWVGPNSRYLLGKIVPFYDGFERNNGYLLIVIDNTEMHQAVRRLRENELLWSQVAHFSKIFTWKYNLRTDRKYISDEIYSYLGVEYGTTGKEELMDSYIATVREQKKKELKKKWQKCVTGKENVVYEYSFETKNGNYNTSRWIKKKENDGEIIYGITVDVSELMHTQKALKENLVRLSLVMESGNLAPWYLDLPTRKLELGAEFFRLFSQRVPAKREFGFAEFTEKIHPDDFVEFQTKFARLQQGLIGRTTVELRIDMFGRGYVWCELNGAVHERGPKNEVVRLLGFITVIQARKDTERKLIKAMEKAEESDRLKSAFLANVSHEIRTPLNAIVGFSELIAHTDDKEEKENFLGIVKTNNEVLLNLINDILDLSRIESGHIDLKESRVDVCALCRELCEVHRMRAAEGVRIVFDSFPAPLVMYTDRNRLHQLYSNLMNNAIKNTRQGSITIGYEQKGDTVECWVRDTGIGMPPDKVEAIFERFEKLDVNSSGFGLGLSICKSILNRMGGSIRVVSELGKGSEFRFVLPYRRADGETGTESKKRSIPTGEKIHRKVSVLVAEDIDCNYLLMEAILGKKYRLLRACNGMEAVTSFSEEQPDLILMDMKMPEMDGIEATRMIRELSRDVPMIAVTAFAFDSDKDKALAAGCNDFITKPVDAGRLTELIEKYTGVR